jgi:hypothetical protein
MGAVICVWRGGISEKKNYFRIGARKIILERTIRAVKSRKICLRFEECDYRLVKKETYTFHL